MCICCCFISSKHHRVAVVSVYSSPSTSLKDAISELGCVLSQLLLHTNHIILADDFNINLLGNSSPVVDYMNLLSDFGILQHVSEPTRLSKTSSTLIDHVISSTPLLATNSVQAAGISNHRIQIVEFNINIGRREPRKLWICSFKKCDWDQVRESLAKAPWNVMNMYDDINDKWEFFHGILKHTFDLLLRSKVHS